LDGWTLFGRWTAGVRPATVAHSRGRLSTIALTDWLLLANDVSDEARFVVGLALEHTDRGPSAIQIRTALPINKDQIARARREIAHKQLAYVDRPTGRTAGTQRYNRPVRLKNFAPKVDHRGPGARYTLLPTDLTALLKGRGGLAACRLLALYHREQMIAGAVQLHPDVAAWRFSWHPEKVRRARQRLLRERILERVEPDLYLIPAAHATAAPDLERFNPAQTRDFHELEAGGRPFRAYASPAELRVLRDLIDRADPSGLPALLESNGSTPVTVDAAQVIPRLIRANTKRLETRIEDNKRPEVRIEDNETADRGQQEERIEDNNGGGYRTETTPLSHSFTSSLRLVDESPSGAADNAPGDEDQRQKNGSGPLRKRHWGPEWSNVFYQADDVTHARIEGIVQELVDRHGVEDARSILRTACLELRGRGRDILAWLGQRVPDHDPDAELEPQALAGDPDEELSLEEETVEAALPLTTAAIKDALGDSRALEYERTGLLRTLESGGRLTPKQLHIVDVYLAKRLHAGSDARATIAEAAHARDLEAALESAKPAPKPEPAPAPPNALDELLAGAVRRVADV
jgi:hypothetical protein